MFLNSKNTVYCFSGPYSYFSTILGSKKIFVWISLDYVVYDICLKSAEKEEHIHPYSYFIFKKGLFTPFWFNINYLVLVVGARLQAVKPDMTVNFLDKCYLVQGRIQDFKRGGWMADHIYWGVLEKMPWLKK